MSSRRQAPRFAEAGSRGERRRLRLELRTIADVGLVGYPNAGKSSLLTALSNARPRVADYPFTTLHPQLGIVERTAGDSPERLTMADIPGIVEDAHRGRGLGLDFLRHVARTRLLVYVLDVADDAAATIDALQGELRAYDASLLERPALIALNKVDLVGASELDSAESELTVAGLPVLRVSALRGEGLEPLRDALFALLPERPVVSEVEPETKRVVASAPLRVARHPSGSGWVVRGRDLESLVERFDATNRDAVAYLQHHFTSLGVNRLLARAGARDGDDVTIAGAVFEYFDEAAGEADARATRSSEAEALRAAERRYLASQERSESSASSVGSEDPEGPGDDHGSGAEEPS